MKCNHYSYDNCASKCVPLFYFLFRSARLPCRFGYSLFGLPWKCLLAWSAMVQSRCGMGQPKPSPGAKHWPTCNWPGAWHSCQMVPAVGTSSVSWGAGWPCLFEWHRHSPKGVQGGGHHLSLAFWLQVCYSLTFHARMKWLSGLFRLCCLNLYRQKTAITPTFNPSGMSCVCRASALWPQGWCYYVGCILGNKFVLFVIFVPALANPGHIFKESASNRQKGRMFHFIFLLLNCHCKDTSLFLVALLVCCSFSHLSDLAFTKWSSWFLCVFVFVFFWRGGGDFEFTKHVNFNIQLML